jgi:protein-tyrosine-phosphatase
MTLLFLDHDCAALAPMAEALARHHGRLCDAWGAGWEPGHVRADAREALEEEGVRSLGLVARAPAEVPLEEVDAVVAFVPDEGRLRLPTGTRRVEWRIPDPTSAPAGERREAYRAARDEITRRLRALLAELDP